VLTWILQDDILIVDYKSTLKRREVMNGEAIKKLREKKGYKQQVFADKIGIHRTYLSEIENNKVIPSLQLLVRIADELGVSVKKFL
jgi:putative transcriptional regulator